jgi:hypothetical protein
MCGIVTVILWVDCTGLLESNYFDCNIVLCLYFPYVMLIITLYIHLHILNLINYIRKCKFVPFVYFPCGMLIITLYIHLQILKLVNCISNFNFVPYLYFLYVMLIITMYNTSTSFGTY